MKDIYIGGAVVVLAMLWARGHSRKKVDQSLSEGTSFANATDWQGSAWERLSNADMTLEGFPNLGGSVNAHPSVNTLKALDLQVNWDGSMGA